MIINSITYILQTSFPETLFLSKIANMQQPKVGVGVIIQNKEQKILIGKRKGSHSPYFSVPGGHLELGETFEEAAIREIQEETSIIIRNPKVISVTNNLNTFKNEGLHYISVNLYANEFEGEAKVMEPNKCEFWDWYDPNDLPLPHFEASEYSIQCFIEKQFYIINQNSRK